MYTNKGRSQSNMVQMPYYPNNANNGKPITKEIKKERGKERGIERGKLDHFKDVPKQFTRQIRTANE